MYTKCVVFPKKAQQQFRCSTCQLLLSKGPIYTNLHDSVTCGRCPRSHLDVPNRPLEALLQTYTFPCSFADNGCPHFLPFNTIALHEEKCKFRLVPLLSPFSTYPEELLEKWTCIQCSKYLTVGPLRLTLHGESVCGRCTQAWTDAHGEDTLFKNGKLETVMCKLPLPCSYYNKGCRVALKWEEVRDHEATCMFRPYRCPLAELRTCDVEVAQREIPHHFQQAHLELYLETPTFIENLFVDSDKYRLLYTNDNMFLLMSKVRVKDDKMLLSIAYLGEFRKAKALKFVLKISNNDRSLQCSFAPHSLQCDKQLHVNESKSMIVSISSLYHNFKATSLQNLLFHLSIKGCQLMSTPKMQLKKCKWERCNALGLETQMTQNHENVCEYKSYGEVANSTPLIMVSILKPVPSNDESTPLLPEIQCQWRNCSKTFSEDKIRKHESECDKKVTRCRFDDCGAVCVGLSAWDRHSANCRHRDVVLRKCFCHMEFTNCGLINHLLEKHAAYIIEGCRVLRVISAKPSTSRTGYVYFLYDGLLFRGESWVFPDGGASFRLTLCALDVSWYEYKHRIRVLHHLEPEKSVLREWYCNANGPCITIPSEELKPCIYDDGFKFEWNIFKNKP